MKVIRFIVTTLLSISAILYILVVGYVYFNQEDMIFQPVKLAGDYHFDYLNRFEEINVQTTDKINLNGLLFKTEKPKGLIFYLHGNAGALDTWGNSADYYTASGYDIFILDYRGFGKSEGSIENEAQFYEDIATVYKALLKKYDEKNMTIIGYSIGTGAATWLASQNHPQRLILQAPYYNFSELCDSKVPYMPEFIKKYKFETNLFLPKAACPVYIFHGNRDQVIPHENSERLSKFLKSGDHFYTLENQDHIGINTNPEYLSALKIILE